MQNAWLALLRTLGTDLWSGRLLVARTGTVIDQSGTITDAALRENIKKLIGGFAQHVRAKHVH